MIRAALTFLLVMIQGCSSPDLIIREDPNLSPTKTNYYTMIFETVCNGKKRISFGQAGCSLDYDSDLSKHSVTVVSPLGGSLVVTSDATKFDKTYILRAGERQTWTLDQLIPRQAEFATYVFYSHWEKPEEIKIEVAVEGQRGLFYYRLRPKGASPAILNWTPKGSATNESIPGMAFSQFRANGQSDEPTLLSIETTQMVGLGRYQLYNEAKQIGIKNTEFSGDEILLSSTPLLGPQTPGTYNLFGWARTETVGAVTLLQLDNDFVVPIVLFDRHTKKLAASVKFTEEEVCYLTENVVSLVAISGIEKASNDIEGCFPRPTGEALLFFYTNVGRAALIKLDGAGGTYELFQ